MKILKGSKSKIITAGILAMSILAISATTLDLPTDRDDLLDQRASLVIRAIGHSLLLQSGDPVSRVLPVRQLSKSIFQLEFQNKFAFSPDSLVKIVSKELQSSKLPLDYMVNVFDCSSNEIVYGFAIRPDSHNVVPCLGREQPRGCYYIQIAFLDLPRKSSGTIIPITVTILCVALTALVVMISKDDRKKTSLAEPGDSIALGKYWFESNKKTLTLDSETIELSDKEAKLLTLFAANQNELIDRDRLLKEVWENEGVFTGRSLDVFVSRLRKKLIKDSSIRLANIHGRGYKLEIG